MRIACVCAAVALLPMVHGGERPEGSGVYAIWYGKSLDLLELPFVRGGQAIAQWREVEPEPGRYNFAVLDHQLRPLAEKGLMATIQINGNRKPDYLFGQVPYFPKPLSHQVNDPQGTLMFWHPVHAAAHERLIEALGNYLRDSKYGKTVLGVRLNFNALGTEHAQIPPTGPRATSQWTVPPGVKPGQDWSNKVVKDYQTMVFQAYLKYVSPHAYVFVRNGLSQELAEEYKEDFAGGRLGWFHTSSEAEPRAGSEWRYQRFHTDCRSGHTTAYAEPWASAWGHHGGKTDDRSCSPPQWNYWRLLLDLHNGVSFIAAYAADLHVAQNGTYRYGKAGLLHDDAKDGEGYREEFAAAFKFANSYAGYHASPRQSPGAWCAFRGNDTVREANGRPEKARKLTFYTGDYNFLMERLPDDSEALGTTGPDEQQFGGWARRLKPGTGMVLRLNEEFAASLADGKAVVQLTFLDEEGASGILRCAGSSREVTGTGTGRWQTLSIPVPVWQGNTVSIQAGGSPLTLHMVEVQRAAAN